MSEVDPVEVPDREDGAAQRSRRRSAALTTLKLAMPASSAPVRILSRYLLASYLGSYAAILIVALLVIAIVEMMVNLDHASSSAGRAGVATYLSCASRPITYRICSPASFAAAFLASDCPRAPRRSSPPRPAASRRRDRCSRSSPPRPCSRSPRCAATRRSSPRAARRFGRHGDGGELFHPRLVLVPPRRASLQRREADRETRTLREVSRSTSATPRPAAPRDSGRQRAIEAEHRWRLGTRDPQFEHRRPEAAPRTRARSTRRCSSSEPGELALLDADPRSLWLERPAPSTSARSDREGRDTDALPRAVPRAARRAASVLVFAVLAIPLGFARGAHAQPRRRGAAGHRLARRLLRAQATTGILGASGIAPR